MCFYLLQELYSAFVECSRVKIFFFVSNVRNAMSSIAMPMESMSIAISPGGAQDGGVADHGVLEAAIIDALASARTDPSGDLCKSLALRTAHFKGKEYYPPERGGKVAVATKEGNLAVKDAMAFLAKQPPLPPLNEPVSAGLKLSAEDHLVTLRCTYPWMHTHISVTICMHAHLHLYQYLYVYLYLHLYCYICMHEV